ncbi:diacylglycerol/lipid kinase family protein [Lutibacter sp.]
MVNKWFVIINPTSGNNAATKNWENIYNELKLQGFNFEFKFTEYKNHSIKLVQNAINKGFTNFICVGGDGTLHNIVNGVLKTKSNLIANIIIGIIPIGTGNDWVKTYAISNNIKEAVLTIKNKKIFKQDIGRIYIESENKEVFFNNLAGVGFDGYVVNNVTKYKKLGSLAYIIAALVSIFKFKRSLLHIEFNNSIIKEKTLMLLIGLCKYSGGGMQLTKNPSLNDGLFDITFIKKITFFTLIKNIRSIFNGHLTNHKLVKTYKTSKITVKNLDTKNVFIQADGELVGTHNFTVTILPEKLNFIVN